MPLFKHLQTLKELGINNSMLKESSATLTLVTTTDFQCPPPLFQTQRTTIIWRKRKTHTTFIGGGKKPKDPPSHSTGNDVDVVVVGGNWLISHLIIVILGVQSMMTRKFPGNLAKPHDPGNRVLPEYICLRPMDVSTLPVTLHKQLQYIDAC